MSFLLPDPDSKQRNGGKVKWIILLLLLVGIAIGLKPGLKQVEKFRAQRLRAQAEALLQQKKFDGAIAKARECLELNPNDQRVLRIIAMALTAQDKEEALPVWQKLLSQPDSSEADRRAMIALALKLQRPDLAAREMETLLSTSGTNSSVETERLAASFYSMKGDLARSLIHARKVLEQSPEDDKTRLITGKVLLHSNRQAEILEGKQVLIEYAQRPDALGWEALQLLSDSGYITALEANDLIQKVDEHPGHLQGKEFLKADLQIKITPYKRNALIQETVQQVMNREKPELLALGRWLNRYEAYALSTRIIDENTALKNRDLLLIYLDALAAQNDWEKVESILAKSDLPLEPVMVKIFQARTARELRQEKVPTLFWEQAQASAIRSPESLIFLARYAERVGEYDHAARAYRNFIALGKNVRPAYEALVRVLEAQGATRPLKDLMAEMVQKYPEDPLPRNDLAYLSLLLNEDVEPSKGVALALIQQFPNILSYKVTLALGYLRSHDLEAAASVIRPLDVDWTQVLPGWRAVYVAVKGSNGEAELAGKFARAVPLARLKAEERTLIQPYLF